MKAKTAKTPKGPPTLLWKTANKTKKNCDTKKFPIQLAAEPIDDPIPRTDIGKISPINNQAIGPHEIANPKMYVAINNIVGIAAVSTDTV